MYKDFDEDPSTDEPLSEAEWRKFKEDAQILARDMYVTAITMLLIILFSGSH